MIVIQFYPNRQKGKQILNNMLLGESGKQFYYDLDELTH